MAEIFEHLEKDRLERQLDWWEPYSTITTRYEPPTANTGYLDRYRLRLVSQVGYVVSTSESDEARSYAHKHARRALASHLYGEQRRQIRKIQHALYSGAERGKISEMLSQLEESMND